MFQLKVKITMIYGNQNELFYVIERSADLFYVKVVLSTATVAPKSVVNFAQNLCGKNPFGDQTFLFAQRP